MILIDQDTRVMVQGITGKEGSFHARGMREYGTQVVAGVTPGKGRTFHGGVPVFDSVREAVAVSSGTGALMVALLAHGVGPGSRHHEGIAHAGQTADLDREHVAKPWALTGTPRLARPVASDCPRRWADWQAMELAHGAGRFKAQALAGRCRGRGIVRAQIHHKGTTTQAELGHPFVFFVPSWSVNHGSPQSD